MAKAELGPISETKAPRTSRPAVPEHVRSRSIAASARAADGHNLLVPLTVAMIVAAAIATAAGWLDAIASSSRDPVDVLTFGGYWRQRLPFAALTGLVTSLGVGLIARAVGKRMGLVTIPRLWHHEPRPTPLLGSLALVAGMAAGVLVAAPGVIASRKLAAAAVGVLAMAAVGLLDDIKGLTPRTRLLSAAIVAEIGWVLGLRAEVFPPGTAGEIANALLTMLWFVGVTHAFNMFDNMDGTSAGVAMASSLSVAALATVSDQGVLVIWALAVAGACSGYLLHNVFPARLYMGDSGALALGFAVAALGLMLQPSTVRPLGFALPVLAVAVPIFDTVMVTISRIRTRKRVAIGGTDHMTHRLHRAGLGVRAVAAFFFLAQLILGSVAGIVALIPRGAGYATVAFTGAAGVVVLVLFLRLPEWQPSADPAGESAPAP